MLIPKRSKSRPGVIAEPSVVASFPRQGSYDLVCALTVFYKLLLWIDLCLPPNSYVEALTLIVTVFGNEVIRVGL